ncbi:nuclear transport factor 2 family protein [Pseudorhodoplanes sp.]|uniref:nuclear transport factor 2 family protein n=1 Tax=Pseudorhodoplanes sp. TaxID=1934341 RepID=UPI00391CFFA8
MEAQVPPGLVNGFFKAYAARDFQTVLDYLSDDVDWIFPGPVDVFPFCGRWRGKAAVIEHFARRAPALFSIRRMELEALLIDGDRAASFSKMTATEQGSERILAFHCAHFVTVRGGKVASLLAVADTFGLLDQLQDVQIMIDPRHAPLADRFRKVVLP